MAMLDRDPLSKTQSLKLALPADFARFCPDLEVKCVCHAALRARCPARARAQPRTALPLQTRRFSRRFAAAPAAQANRARALVRACARLLLASPALRPCLPACPALCSHTSTHAPVPPCDAHHAPPLPAPPPIPPCSNALPVALLGPAGRPGSFRRAACRWRAMAVAPSGCCLTGWRVTLSVTCRW